MADAASETAAAAAAGRRRCWALRGHRGGVLCVEGGGEASPRLLASGGEDGTGRVWDTRVSGGGEASGGRCVRHLGGMGGDEVASVSWVPGEPHLVLCAAGRDLHWFDLRKEAVVLRAPRHSLRALLEEDANQVSVSPSGRHACVAEDAGRAVVVDMATRRVFKTLRGRHENICMAAAFRRSRPWEVVTGGLDQRLFMWDFSRGVAFRDASAPAAPGAGPMVNPPMINALAAHPDDALLAAALGSGAVALWDMNEKEWAAALPGHHHAAAHVHFPAFSPRRHLVSAGSDRTVVLWDLERSASAAPALERSRAFARKRNKKKKQRQKKKQQQQQAEEAKGGDADADAGPALRAPELSFRDGDQLSLETQAMADRWRLREKPNWTTTIGDASHLAVYVADAGDAIMCYEV